MRINLFLNSQSNNLAVKKAIKNKKIDGFLIEKSQIKHKF